MAKLPTILHRGMVVLVGNASEGRGQGERLGSWVADGRHSRAPFPQMG